MDAVSIKTKLDVILKDKNWTKAKLLTKLNCSSASLYQWSVGNTIPRAKYTGKIDKIYNSIVEFDKYVQLEQVNQEPDLELLLPKQTDIYSNVDWKLVGDLTMAYKLANPTTQSIMLKLINTNN